jgi:hypothetical protein
MSGQTQLGRLRAVRQAGTLPWRYGDGWLLELGRAGLIRMLPGDIDKYEITTSGRGLLDRVEGAKR